MTKKMHICVISDSNNPHTKNWVKYFIDNGHRVSIISFTPDAIKGAEVVFIKTKAGEKLKFILSAPKVKNIINKLNPDIVHAHYITGRGFLGAFSNKHPLVLSAWGSDLALSQQMTPALKWILKYAILKADFINTSAEHLNPIIGKLGFPNKRVEAFQYGIDIESIDNAKEQKKAERIRIISSRDWKPFYNIELLINAFGEIIRLRKNAELVIYGSGTENQKKLLEKAVSDNKVGEFVAIIGYVPQEELYSAFKSSDIFVSIPESDGTPLSLLESMYCGAFPVVSDILANKNWIDDGKNGLMVRTNKASVADGLLKAIENEQLRITSIEKNRLQVVQKADRTANMKRMEKIYLELIDEKKS